MTKKQKNQKGMTIIEILLTVAILGILGAGVLGLQYILSQNQTLVLRNYVSIDQANSNITSLTKELRMASEAEDASFALESLGDNEIIFYSDYDFDGQTERLRYFLDGSSFKRGVIEPTDPPATYPEDSEKIKILTRNVRNASEAVFTYYNGDWPQDTENNPLSIPVTLSDVKLVKIFLRLNPRSDQPDKDFSLESSASMRMLKENL